MTITMIYVLMSLIDGPKYGKEIADWVSQITEGSIILGPGTLYTMLSSFEKKGYIKETYTHKTMRTYTISKHGIASYVEALYEYKQMIQHAQGVMQ